MLGCGPSLRDICIPPHAFSIGVNNSYLKHWSPIYATCDSKALKRDVNRAHALSYYSAVNPKKVGVERKDVVFFEGLRVARSGTFAYWLALQCFKATKVYLAGFDMDFRQGHFTSDEVQPVDYSTHTKPVLRRWWEEFQVPTKIWRDGWVDLREAL